MNHISFFTEASESLMTDKALLLCIAEIAGQDLVSAARILRDPTPAEILKIADLVEKAGGHPPAIWWAGNAFDYVIDWANEQTAMMAA